ADTMCRLDRSSRVLVAEVGSRGPGHIAEVMPLLRPDVAVVTSVAGSHLEMFGDLAGVAAAKAELVDGVGPEGFAILNADDPRVAAMAARCGGTVVTYGLEGAGAEVRPDVFGRVLAVDELARHTVEVDGIRFLVPLPGLHNASNALAALAVARVLGHDPVAAAGGLAAAHVSPWRSELRRTADGVTVLNDAYNASPESMAAAFRVLTQLPGRRRVAVLGRMAEMGASEVEGHRRVGREAVSVGGVEVLVVVGAAHGIVDGAAEAGLEARHAADPQAAAALVADLVRPGDVVLVKASRSSGLEVVAHGLLREETA
ncbi:MAG: UDP-N-acetylmuramoyl-tripeptide--D-alanyl-D-alanine ligase, partial [Actinobacteria bacterium]|nr:UDP-N-acetylmuramoyl-tripeptide--D-alanyl-D-alanine ligase [Actinomycetota bacterium]